MSQPQRALVLSDAILDDNVNGYWLTYTNHFLGRRLRHGVAQRRLALFRVGKALYEQIDEDAWSRLDMEVHEHPIVEGATGAITKPIDHRDRGDLASFLERHIDYARWETRRAISLRDASARDWQNLTKR